MNLEHYFYIGTAVVGVLCLLRAIAVPKSQALSDYLLDITLTAAGIYLVNSILGWQQIESGVGINGFTIFIGSVLGLPGLIMTYGISLLG